MEYAIVDVGAASYAEMHRAQDMLYVTLKDKATSQALPAHDATVAQVRGFLWDAQLADKRLGAAMQVASYSYENPIRLQVKDAARFAEMEAAVEALVASGTACDFTFRAQEMAGAHAARLAPQEVNPAAMLRAFDAAIGISSDRVHPVLLATFLHNQAQLTRPKIRDNTRRFLTENGVLTADPNAQTVLVDAIAALARDFVKAESRFTPKQR